MKPDQERPDLRVVLLACCAWAGSLLVLLGSVSIAVAAVAAAAGAAAVAVRHRSRTSRGPGTQSGSDADDRRGARPPWPRPSRAGTWLLVGCAVVTCASASTAALRVEQHRATPVARLAQAQTSVSLTARVASDPVRREGRFAPYVLVRLSVRTVEGLGRSYRSAVPVLVIGDLDWLDVRLGDTVEATGRLRPAQDETVAAVLLPRRAPTVVAEQGALLSGADVVRRGIRASVVHGSRDAEALVPALVVGDDRQLSAEVVEDFRTTGLTHLAAVSGTNLTLVVGFLLVLARWAGVRGRGLVVIGGLGVVGFVLLARTEPSVVRAAAMGTVGLIGMGSHGRTQGARALGVAVLVLVLVDPWLAVSWGFVLSAQATAGILFLGPVLRDALMRWAPRWVAEAVAVPFAAQLACTPAVAALSGQVSLVAVIANLLVAAAVGPATVLGLVGGLLMPVLPWAGVLVGTGAAASAWWIIAVATHLAPLPTAAVHWAAGPLGLAVLCALCAAIAAGSPWVFARRGPAVLTAAAMTLVVLVPLPSPGWPPSGWVMVACDVGQGDGLVLNAGEGRAVVVDAGPDPPAIDRCLDRLGVREVPVVVLTHFHADHVDGLPGVLDGRRVDRILVTGLADPPAGAEEVRRWAGAAGIPVRTARFGEVHQLGLLRWQVIGPARLPRAEGPGSPPNNASTVLLVESRGVRILASGDIEPPAQEMLHAAVPDLRVDVLKVPHHGSADQDPELIGSLGAVLAVISVGVGNDYGHPAPATLALLEHAGLQVRRTDQDGDVAVRVVDGRLRVSTSGPRTPG
ncbi:ComEC/Rec2 family competence protein [Nocardioides mesophilus]|uniref:ComEC/Rec2 family competence protein n=1 Tax=Nocardioides mesophilus TaxID=433659 RepID=A0A7G9RCN7_9ACTN|nr:ComEC/Rec2 family competence protein [Nocardioides mesophilus]QNN53362.1 ComEC/Rec2 family competence protein [Nocardioides mesophilus]